MLEFEEVIATVVKRLPLRLVAIDGLPLAGKSTLADRLASAVAAQCVRLDDFVRREQEWRSHDQPSFPFDYIRYGEFMAGTLTPTAHTPVMGTDRRLVPGSP